MCRPFLPIALKIIAVCAYPVRVLTFFYTRFECAAFGLQLFHPPRWVAVPALAAGAMPKMLARLKAAGRAAVAHQGAAGMLQRLQHCGRYGVLPLRGQPLVGNRQRGFLLQVAQQPALTAGAVLLLAALPGLALGVCLQLHQGQHQVQRWGLGITLAQQGNGWRFLATGLGNVLQQWQGQGPGQYRAQTRASG